MNYVAVTGDAGIPSAWGRDRGGVGTRYSNESGTIQAAYASTQWGGAVAYTYASPFDFVQAYLGAGTRLVSFIPSSAGSTSSLALSGYMQPAQSGWLPSLSVGWEINVSHGNSAGGFAPGELGSPDSLGNQTLANYGHSATTQSWSVGPQWLAAFVKGNALGMGVGQTTFPGQRQHLRDTGPLLSQSSLWSDQWCRIVEPGQHLPVLRRTREDHSLFLTACG